MRIQKPADLARIVKTQRQARGLTQQDIADAVGITRQSLARIEHGHGGASFDTVLRIFEKLGIRLETTPSSQRSLVSSIPRDDTLRKNASDALTAIRKVEASDLVAAAAAAAQSLDTSALTSAAYRNVDISAIAAAAATGNIDTSALLSRWRTILDDLTDQVQEDDQAISGEPPPGPPGRQDPVGEGSQAQQ